MSASPESFGRVDAFEAADAEVRHAAAIALAGTFSGLLAPRPGRLRQGKEACGRRGTRLAGRSPLRGSLPAGPGPDNLRWLIEHGPLDPCVLGALVTRGSQAGIGVDFLTKALGTDRFDAPRRAALLSACPCPTAVFHPVWVERMATTLLTGRDPPGKGDPRRWYRDAAANLLGTHPAGLDKPAEDALERVVTCAASNEFSPAGKQALARIRARPETLRRVALQMAGRNKPLPPREQRVPCRPPGAPDRALPADGRRRGATDVANPTVRDPVRELTSAAFRWL